MKLSIVLAGNDGRGLFSSLQKLVAVVSELEEAGSEVETVVVAYAGQPDVDMLQQGVEGARFERPEPRDGSVLERWADGADVTDGDVLWLIGPESDCRSERLFDLLAVLHDSVEVVPAGSHVLLRRTSADLLAAEPVADASSRKAESAVAAILGRAGALGRRHQTPPMALPPGPFLERREEANLGLWVRRWFHASIHEEVPYSVKIGRHGYADVGTVIRQWSSTRDILIGNFTFLAAGVLISNPPESVAPADRLGPDGLRPTRGHNPGLATIGLMYTHVPAIEHRYAVATTPCPMTIGHDVWICSNATVVGSVTIGNGAIVTAGSVVLRDVPPYAIVEGNPAKVVRMRFSPDVVESLQRIEWWNWDDADLAARADWFTRPIVEFCDRFDPRRRSARLSAARDHRPPAVPLARGSAAGLR